MMTNEHTDWTTWIITTIMAALTTMIGTVVFLAKLIESKYVIEIRELKMEMNEMIVKHEDCLQKHHEAELRLARLESQVIKNTTQIGTNTTQIKAHENHGNN